MLLIVDDNREVRRMIRSLVEDIDADVVECSDGSEALEACFEHRPDWILMDVSMSPMDGLTATRRIVSLLPGTRIVIVTAFSDNRTRRKALEAGACGFCGKEDLTGLRGLLLAGCEENTPIS